MSPLHSYPVYVETAMGRFLMAGLVYPRTASRARIWDVLRSEGWTATNIRFDNSAHVRGWIARAFVSH